MKRQRCCAVSV